MIAECHHIMPDGRQCGSPALRGQQYCFYHHPDRKPRRPKTRPRYPGLDPETLPQIDSPAAIQRTLSGVLQALAANTISFYQAQTMLYALQLASNLSS